MMCMLEYQEDEAMTHKDTQHMTSLLGFSAEPRVRLLEKAGWVLFTKT